MTADDRTTDDDAKAPPAPQAPPPRGSDDPLAPALRAVERGDLREARRLAAELARSGEGDVATRARALLDQLAVDPVIVGVMIATGALILALAVAFIVAHAAATT